MRAAMEMLRPMEAATVASVSLREVNRVIDERILPDDLFVADGGRLVDAIACPLISFYFASAGDLTSEKRLFAIRETGYRLSKFPTLALSALVEGDWIIRSEFLTIDFGPFVRGAKERMGRLIAARALVMTDPGVLGGTPVVRGTRIPVYDVAASVGAGIPTDRILAAYPGLDAEKLALATLYAEANPLRGRPRKNAELPAGAVVISDHCVPRRQKVG